MRRPPAAADRLDDVKARGKVMVGVSDTTPPFSFKKAGEATVGYDIDLVHAVAKRLGVAVETVSVSSAERIPMLKDGKLDFVATSMTRTPERLKEIDFSEIYFVTPHAVIVRKSSGITSVHQLAGKKASSASTSTAGANLKEAVPERRDRLCARLRRSPSACSRTARSTPSRPTRACCAQSCSRTAIPTTICSCPDFTKSRNVGFALKKDEPRFKDAINRALLDVEASGEAAKIFDAWFGPKSPEPMPRKFKIQAD